MRGPSTAAEYARASAKLPVIEAGRGLAATGVVLSHAAHHVTLNGGSAALSQVIGPGHAGVDFFFVLSGFIIATVHSGDIGRPDRLPRYLGRRFTRIFPIYWVALALSVAVALTGGRAAPSLGRMVSSLLLLPVPEPPLLGVAWTLQHEVVFYAGFALLIAMPALGWTWLGIWFGGSAATALGWHPAPWFGAPVFDPYNLEFIAGLVAARWASRRYPLQVPPAGASIPAPSIFADPLFVVGALVFTGAMGAEAAGLYAIQDPIARLLYALPGMLIIIAAARPGLRAPPLLLALGAASYAIYLFQFLGMGVVWQTWRMAIASVGGPGLACFALLACAGVAGGVAASRLVEHPLTRLVRVGVAMPARRHGPA